MSVPIRRTARRAFSVIELLVVIAIVALLLGMLVPYLAKSRRAAQILKEQVNMRSIGQATVLFAGDYKNQVPEPMGLAVPGLLNAGQSGGSGIDGGDIATMYTFGNGNAPAPGTLSSRIGDVRTAAGVFRGRAWGLGQLVGTGFISSPDLLFSADPNAGFGKKASDYAIARGVISDAKTPGIPVNTGDIKSDFLYLPYSLKKARANGTWNKYRKLDEMPPKVVLLLNGNYVPILPQDAWYTGGSGYRHGNVVVNCVHADGHVAQHNTAGEILLQDCINAQQYTFGASRNLYTGMYGGGSPSPQGGQYASSGSRMVDYLERNP